MLIEKSHLTLASAAALFAFANVAMTTSAYAADQGSQEVSHCYGVNACKGQSDCKSGNHDCKGMNSCKGQGFKDLSAGQCSAQHGSSTEK
jgi:uncharacterized membrane protein